MIGEKSREALQQCCPLELSAIMEMFNVYAKQCGSYVLAKCRYQVLEMCLVWLRNWFSDFNLNLNNHMWLVATILGSAALEMVRLHYPQFFSSALHLVLTILEEKGQWSRAERKFLRHRFSAGRDWRRGRRAGRNPFQANPNFTECREDERVWEICQSPKIRGWDWKSHPESWQPGLHISRNPSQFTVQKKGAQEISRTSWGL